jgi:predicted MFS family arabinose efflux permease
MLHLHRGVWLLLANTVGTTLGLAVVLLIYNLYLVALGYHEDFIGEFTALNALAMSAGALAAIPLSRYLGNGGCLLLASILVVISCFGLGFAALPAPILAWGTLNGFAAGQLLVPGGPLVIALASREDRQHAFAAYFGAQSLSQAVGSAVAGIVPVLFATALALNASQSILPLRLTVVGSGVLSVLGVLPALGLVRVVVGPSKTATAPQPDQAWPRRRSDRQVIALFATISFLWALGIGFVLPFLNVYLADRLGGTTADVGLIFALNSAAMVVASPLAPALARRLGVVTAIASARGLAVLTMLGMIVAPALLPASILFVARGGLVALTWPLDAHLGLELTSPRQGATMSSVKSIAFNVGWAISSLVGGQIIFQFGYPAAFAVAAATTAIAAGAQFRLFRGDDPHPGLRARRVGITSGETARS